MFQPIFITRSHLLPEITKLGLRDLNVNHSNNCVLVGGVAETFE